MFFNQPRLSRVISQAALFIAIGVLLLPLVMIVKISFEGQGGYNFTVVIRDTPFFRFLLNSAIIAASTVLAATAFSVAAAYATSVLRPRGQGVVTFLILAGLSVPAIGLVVPVFTVMQTLGLIDTYWAVIVPLTALSIPFGVLVGSNYIRSIPLEVFEAASLDGAGSWRIFVGVLIPIARPIITVIALFTFLAAWNEYLLPLLFLQDPDLKVVTQVPTYFQSEHLVDTPKIFAANILISVPVVALYLMFQGTFRRGLASGAIK